MGRIGDGTVRRQRLTEINIKLNGKKSHQRNFPKKIPNQKYLPFKINHAANLENTESTEQKCPSLNTILCLII